MVTASDTPLAGRRHLDQTVSMDRLADRSLESSLVIAGADQGLPSHVSVIVVGGGIIGSSIALHLARSGLDDVVLLERNAVTSGTTWHAAGLIASARGSLALTELARYGPDFYTDLEAQTGVELSVTRSGSLSIARRPGRVDELMYAHDVAEHAGVPSHVVEPSELPELWPLLCTDGILAALHFPGDGYVNPGYANLAMIQAAHAAGVAVHEQVEVSSLLVESGVARGVRTTRGEITADVVVIAAGLWSRDLAATAGVSLPLYAAEHVHVRSHPLSGVHHALPVLRDVDSSFYIRTELDRLLVGAFEPRGLPRAVSEISREGHAEFPADWDHFDPIRRKAEDAVPVLREAGYDRFINAPESFTPDTNFLLGETAELERLFIAAGMNSQGIIYAPGVGRELARWIIEGAPGFDSSSVDVQRFSAHQSNRRYLHERTRESLGRLYAMHWPAYQSTTARNVRRTPLHSCLQQLDARFGELNGWERANYFAGPALEDSYSYLRPGWFDQVAVEHAAIRESVGLFDLSAFTKVEVIGTDALEVCQRAATADVDTALGKVTYSLFLNDRGGIELDGTITRLDTDRFLVVTPSFSHAKTMAYLRRVARDLQAEIVDCTSGWATIGVMGPASRELMTRVSPADWSNSAHPLYSARHVEVADGFGRVLRLSYAGELGYEVYVPTELAVNVYEALWEAGQELDVRPTGYFALDSLRLEKGYRHLGHDMGPGDDPYSVGLGFAVARHKTVAFRGAAALGSIDPGHPPRRSVHVLMGDPTVMLFHDETLFDGDRQVGHITSGAYGHTLGAAVGIATVDADLDPDGDFSVRIRGRRHSARVSMRPFFDPSNIRMLAAESEQGGQVL